MSDFGAIIIFRKKDGNFDSDDKNKIVNELKKVITEKEFTSNIVGGNFSELKIWQENACCSMITEYYDDENANQIWDFAKENDIEDCKRIIKLLKSNLPDDFSIEAKFEEW